MIDFPPVVGFEPVTFRLRVGRGNHYVTRPLLKCTSINMFDIFNMTGRGKGGKEEGKAKQVQRGFWPQMTEKCRKLPRMLYKLKSVRK